MALAGFDIDMLKMRGHETVKKAAGDAGNAPLAGTVFTPRQVRLLKVAVIVMGVLLVGGFAFVLAAIVYQASHAGQAAMAPVPGPSAAPGFDLPVGKDAQVTAMSLDGGRLALHLSSSEGAEIVVIDLASGKVVSPGSAQAPIILDRVRSPTL